MIESFSDVILIAKISLTFLSRIDLETLSKLYKFGNRPIIGGCVSIVWLFPETKITIKRFYHRSF
jgi:hypothetical protein